MYINSSSLWIILDEVVKLHHLKLLRLSSFEPALVLNNYFSGAAELGRGQIMPTTLLLPPPLGVDSA